MFIPESPAGLVGYFVVRQTVVVSAALALKLIGQNAQRVGISITVSTGVQGRIGLSQTVLNANGGWLVALGADKIFDFATHGSLVNSEFYAAGGVGTTYTITEIIYNPQ